MAKTDYAAKTAELMGPARALNELNLSSAERLLEMQLENTRKYATVVLEGMKEAAAVKDAADMKEYLNGRMEAARTATESLRSDTEAFFKFGQEYMTEAQKIMKSGLESWPKAAA